MTYGPLIPRDHEFFRELSEDEQIEFLADILSGALTLGIPEAYLMAESIHTGDEDQFWYSLRVTATIHTLWYNAWRAARAWDLFRHGGKNVLGMNFHRAMQGVNAMRGVFYRSVLTNPIMVPVAAAIGTVAYADMLSDPSHPYTRGLVQERKAGVVSFGGPAFF